LPKEKLDYWHKLLTSAVKSKIKIKPQGEPS